MAGRRIIYIKNPTQGSHFRTIGGRSSSSPSKTPKAPKAPGTPAPGIPSQNQYGGGYSGYDWSGWAQGGPRKPDPKPGPTGELPGYGVGPYVTPEFEAFQQASTLLGMWYDIFTNVDPYTGDYQPGLGAPGTLKPFYEASFGAYETWKAPGASRYGGNDPSSWRLAQPRPNRSNDQAAYAQIGRSAYARIGLSTSYLPAYNAQTDSQTDRPWWAP